MPGREWQHPTMGSGPRPRAPSRRRRAAGTSGSLDRHQTTDGLTVEGGIIEQAEACFGKLKALVETAGGSMADFVMLNIYVTDPKYLREIDPVKEKYFPDPPYPPGVASRSSPSPGPSG